MLDNSLEVDRGKVDTVTGPCVESVRFPNDCIVVEDAAEFCTVSMSELGVGITEATVAAAARIDEE